MFEHIPLLSRARDLSLEQGPFALEHMPVSVEQIPQVRAGCPLPRAGFLLLEGGPFFLEDIPPSRLRSLISRVGFRWYNLNSTSHPSISLPSLSRKIHSASSRVSSPSSTFSSRDSLFLGSVPYLSKPPPHTHTERGPLSTVFCSSNRTLVFSNTVFLFSRAERHLFNTFKTIVFRLLLRRIRPGTADQLHCEEHPADCAQNRWQRVQPSGRATGAPTRPEQWHMSTQHLQ